MLVIEGVKLLVMFAFAHFNLSFNELKNNYNNFELLLLFVNKV